MQIDRVLFPTDFSETAEEALAQAAEMARFFEAELWVLHVIPPLRAYLRTADDDSTVDDFQHTLEKDAEERISALSQLPQLTIQWAVRRSDAIAETILDFARESKSDVIVMATHGRRGLRKWLAGSVTQEVVRESDRPVLTLRRREHGLNFERAGSFLVPIDFSESSHRALLHAREIAARSGASLQLLHVTERPMYPNFYPEVGGGAAMATTAYDLTPLRERSEHELRALFESQAGPEVPAEFIVEEGRPADRILDISDKKSSDLIIMASHGLSGLSHLLLGSVTEAVMQRANRPVLILRSEQLASRFDSPARAEQATGTS